ncbi:hypothetical protein PSACC_01883 [Paramicrosporidium saccamoebae]|uniref:26S proteasome regulatory subunit RPN1 n=1 Tax=Paramicrosporidium saccamoebae TaxID=1246581 RepID=A0A2H9TKP4_9FUNG|nr:hypothetical protein PSACC_01883 [Paramicrosporidium saccamoebae]
MADILSVIAMTQGNGESSAHETLKYRMCGEQLPIGDWGHEYVRHLAMEIMGKFPEDSDKSPELLSLAKEVACFFLDHNSEPDACDLLYEIESLSLLVELVTIEGRDHERVCRYLLSCLPYESDVDDRAVLEVAHQIYSKMGSCADALLVAMRLNDPKMISDDFYSCKDPLLQKQLAYLLARQRITPQEGPLTEELGSILNNTFLTDHYLTLGKELEILEPKTPEDIYKSHLQDSLRVAAAPSPRHNLASAFVNAFANAGYGTDKLVTSPEIEADETKSWIYKTKDHGILSTVASIGMLNLWNADTGLGKLDRYLYSENVNIKAGAILGIGLVHAGTKNESDPALALLREYLETEGEGSDDVTIKTVALIGLALAYGGSGRADVVEPILPLISGHADIQVSAMAALAVGHVFVGSCNGDLASTILQALMERDAEQLDKPVARFLALALALLYLGKTEVEAEVILETLQAVEHPIAKDASTLVKICSYAGSGNVLRIQEMLRFCTLENNQSEKDGKDEKNDKGEKSDKVTDNNFQTFAVIGIALICMMEDIGKEMSHRLFSHLMHYGSPSVRKAVPLALGLLYTSHPTAAVMDLLSKYSHDHDKAVAVNAIFSMGLIAAGTNNAKMAQMLRQLAAYYQRDVDCLYVVRIAQGLVHAGKGTVTMSPIHSHRLLINPAAFAGLLTTAIAFTDAQSLLLENTSYLLYFLATAIYPRFVVALDESLQPTKLFMRVGQAVDVVGQAGKPKTITGFQTHSTPVLLAYQERAELATEEYLSLSPILENFVIVRKNPEWIDESTLVKKSN